ncbi:hypothetical protein [Bacillus cereus]|nr:hypothetical protein [Bacillus cereus]
MTNFIMDVLEQVEVGELSSGRAYELIIQDIENNVETKELN